uniref:Mutagen-sensitive 301 (inferred by orthology to a D. melanogaster protein) n=1 Tax=Strongyloides venezuelensis TaxID=75913 RepID=A0A0K0EZ93_STRVS
MSCQRKRTSNDDERCSDGDGASERLTTLSSPCRKKVKRDWDDIGSLEPNAFGEPRMLSSEQVSSASSLNVNANVDRGDSPAPPSSDSSLLSDDASSEKMTDERCLNTGSGNTSNFSDDLDNNIHSLTMDDVFKKLGLPKEAQELYKKKKNVCDLYDWQKECLTDPELLKGKNYILSLKSGAGKSLVAEIMMLREALVKNRSSIIILPYVAGTQEKVQSLSLFEELEIFVEEYARRKGIIPPGKRSKEHKIYVATIEKAGMLINSLIKENRLEEIGLVVIDGLHMIGQGERGYIIERLILKYLMSGSGQIIGMSSALGTDDESEMCKFMEATLFSSDFEPMKVVERVMMGGYLFNVNNEGDLVLHGRMLTDSMYNDFDLNSVISLVKDIIPQKPVLIFCSSKDSCEYVCKALGTLLPESYRILDEERQEVIDIIKNLNSGAIDEAMEIGIRAGIAYHHSRLTDIEKYWIETAFKNEILCVLCATSTLAAGVNLPVRRVIINQPKVREDFIDKSQYLQMIGRAGRGGYKGEGESITIVGEEYEEEFQKMLKSPLKSCQSQMLNELCLRRFILELVDLELVRTVKGIQDSISKTLAGIQDNDKCVSLMEKALETLKKDDMVKIENGIIWKSYDW